MNTNQRLKFQVKSIVEPLTTSMNMDIVELVVSSHKNGVRINLILYNQDGITLDDLVKLQKSVRPRLELEINRNHLTLEVSSPGINRVLKSQEECCIFQGRKVRALKDNEWYSGVLTKFNHKGHVAIAEQEGKIKQVSFLELRKVVLD